MRLEKQQWIIAALASGAASLVALLLAVATAHWLLMTEYCSASRPNETIIDNFTYIFNYGLWQFCTRVKTAGSSSDYVSCLEIGFTDMGVSNADRDDALRSGSVALATRVAIPAIISAAALTVMGFLLSILGNCRRDKRTIIAAVMYILSGVCLSDSIILFISRINDELSLQPTDNCADFTYTYDWSFYLIGVAFVMEETSAVISIKIFLMQNSKLEDMIKLFPALEDKLLENSRLGDRDISTSQTLIW